MTGRVFLVAIACFIVQGCSAITDVSRELRIELTASKTSAAVGEQLTFRVEASGAALLSLVVRYGDDAEDEQQTFGSQVASGNFVHAYSAAGSYDVEAFAVEASGAVAAKGITVTVQ
jgi:hypothetical protein